MADDVIDNDTGEVLDPLPATMSPMVAAEINQQVATAKQYPRRRDKEISDEIISRSSLNEAIATECMYSLRRGDNAITGPSIRFAEIVRASYGNIRVAARFVRIDQDDPLKAAVIVEAVALDLQTNNAEVIPNRRSVMTSGKGGRKPQMFSADMINMTINAATALARRNAILAVVPKAVWIDGYQRVIKVLQGDVSTLAKRRQEIFDAFGRIKVEPATLHGILKTKSIEDVTLEHMPTLHGMMNAIREGEAVDSVLGRFATDEPAHVKVANPLRDKPEEAKTAPAEQIRTQAAENTEQKVEEAVENANSGSGAFQPKDDPRFSTGPQTANAGAGKPASEPAAEDDGKATATQDDAQAASQKAADLPPDDQPYNSAETYMEYMRDEFDAAKSKSAVTDVWARTRADRAMYLSPEQLEELTKDRDAKLRSFAGKV